MACSVSSCRSGDTGSKPRSRINSWVRDLSGPCRHQITSLVECPGFTVQLRSEEEPSGACLHLQTISYCLGTLSSSSGRSSTAQVIDTGGSCFCKRRRRTRPAWALRTTGGLHIDTYRHLCNPIRYLSHRRVISLVAVQLLLKHLGQDCTVLVFTRTTRWSMLRGL